MKIRKLVILIATHGFVGVLGFAAGIYFLPILTAPPAPTESELNITSAQAEYTAHFTRELEGSDALHWGEGEVSVGSKFITFKGELAPGPDYILYLSPEFVETEADFNDLKPSMVSVGDVKTFNNFVVEIPSGIDTSEFTSVIVWCESFGEFITSAKYR